MEKKEGALLERWLTEQGMNPNQLASKLGVYGSTVKHWLGVDKIGSKHRAALIKLGVPLEAEPQDPNHQGQILKKYFADNKIKVKDIAEAMGIHAQALSNNFKVASLAAGFISKLKAAGIDIFGKDYQTNVGVTNVIQESNAVYVSEETNIKRARVVHAQAYAGYLFGMNDENYIKELPEHFIYVDEPGVYRTFEVKGDSMEPEFPQGCLVDAKKLDNVHWRKLIPGRVFVFVHNEMGLNIKMLLKQEGQHCTFRAINEFYDDFTIDLDDVRELWYFVQKHDTNRDYSRYLVR